jgi:SAM-dependent methyltransferase
VSGPTIPAHEVARINQEGWDRRVDEGDVWTRPVSPEETRRARQGDWSVVLTPNTPVPRDWFGEVVVFDASARQLGQDQAVARRDGLAIATQQGFMHDLSVFAGERFDIVFHPVSNSFAPEIEPVWRECFRVLRRGGVLLAGFMNPIVYIFDADAQDRGELVVRFSLPYSDVADLPPDELRRVVARDHTVEFSHTLDAQIGGQLRAGLVLTHLFEDKDCGSPDTGRSRFFPTCLATRALKL